MKFMLQDDDKKNVSKERAGRNRTVTLHPDEVDFLKSQIITPDKLEVNNLINQTINGDLLSVIDLIDAISTIPLNFFFAPYKTPGAILQPLLEISAKLSILSFH